MADPLGAAVTFFALGANFLAAALLLLFNPRGRVVRWYSAFNAAIIVWLLGQGIELASLSFAGVRELRSVAVAMMPGLFLAFALVDAGRPGRAALAVVGLGALLMPVVVPWLFGRTVLPFGGVIAMGWQACGWLVGAALLWRNGVGRRGGDARPAGDAAIAHVLLTLVPLCAVVAMLVGGSRFFLFFMPLATVGVQLLIFIGVVRHRFYDIEVRAARRDELLANAAEAERLAVIGELAASVAHEVRNPLTGVRSLAQRIAEDDVDADRRRRYAAVILDEVGRVDRIVTRLLGLAKRQPARDRTARAFPLAPLFEDLLLLVGPRAGRAGVRIEADAAGAAVHAPRESLTQALLNLLLNAIAHSPPGGRVELVARPVGQTAEGARAGVAVEPANGTVERSGAPPADVTGAIEILVRDQGPGVPPAARDRIFEPFRTSTPGGSGLGLSVVRGLCRELGWQVSVNDAPGGGAEFRLCVPAAPAGQPAANAPATALPPAGAGTAARPGVPGGTARGEARHTARRSVRVR